MNWITVRQASLHNPKEGMQAIVMTHGDVAKGLPGMHCTWVDTPSFQGWEPVHCEKCEGVGMSSVAMYLPLPKPRA